MSGRYRKLLAPIKVGNTVLKNRMVAAPSSPHFLQTPEKYPSDGLITHYARKAQNGASLVVVSQALDVTPQFDGNTLKIRRSNPNEVNPDHGTDSGHFIPFDLADGGCQNYLSLMTETVHFYDGRILMKPKIDAPREFDVSPGNIFSSTYNGVPPSPAADRKEVPEEILKEVIRVNVEKAVLAKEVGFDGFFLHMAYRAPLAARMLSPLTNRRTDRYGGSLENRARFSIELADAIKKRCGRDFLLVASMSGCEPEGGYPLEDAAEYAKLFTGHIDLIYIKGDPGDRDSAPTNFLPERTPFLYMAQSMKEKGVTLPIAINGGFMDLDDCEAAIASGKTDMVAMARAWIANENLGELAQEGRGEDVVPCLRCNMCHGAGYFKPWVSVCAVNPVWGYEHKIDSMVKPSAGRKKVAVVGGGPSGMKSALVAAERGHDVTLYEKREKLGGLLNVYDHYPFKWPHRDFKDYLVRQIAKSGIKVRLNTEIDCESLKVEPYDALIAAVGAEPAFPDIPGAKGENVLSAVDIYGREGSLAKNIVVVGGGGGGTDTGMYLAGKGHHVTVLEMGPVLAPREVRWHFYSALTDAWKRLPTFHYVLNARCTEITQDGAVYRDADGKTHTVSAGTVVLATGMKGKQDFAMTLYGAADRFFMVGDCREAGDIQRAMRTAFAAASML